MSSKYINISKIHVNINYNAHPHMKIVAVGMGANRDDAPEQFVLLFKSSQRLSGRVSWMEKLAKKMERTWSNVVFLIVDKVSFIGRAFFWRMHSRLKQGRRRHFSESALDPND